MSVPKYPNARKAALFASVIVSLFYAMTLLQALGWNDDERFLTQLVMAPIAVAFWAAVAFAMGALFDGIGGRADKSSPPATPAKTNYAMSAHAASVGRYGDPYKQAGQEILSGEVRPELWARSLASAGETELAVKAEYVRLRVAQLLVPEERSKHEEPPLELTDELPSEVQVGQSRMAAPSIFTFSVAELSVYGPRQLFALREVLRKDDEDQISKAHEAISRKIGRSPEISNGRAFLKAYSDQLDRHLIERRQFTFTDDELAVYGRPELNALRDVLRTGNADKISHVREAIGRKIGRSPGDEDKRAFLESYHEQLSKRLSGADSPSSSRSKLIFGGCGIALFLALGTYIGRDQSLAPNDAVEGMSAYEALAYRDCMERSASYSISEYAMSDICRKSALSLDTNLDCHTEWDGRANPTECE